MKYDHEDKLFITNTSAHVTEDQAHRGLHSLIKKTKRFERKEIMCVAQSVHALLLRLTVGSDVGAARWTIV